MAIFKSDFVKVIISTSGYKFDFCVKVKVICKSIDIFKLNTHFSVVTKKGEKFSCIHLPFKCQGVVLPSFTLLHIPKLPLNAQYSCYSQIFNN